GGPATGPPPLSRLPGAVRVDGDPRARGGAGAIGPGRSGFPARRPVRVPGDERLLSGGRCRPATQPGDLRRPHPRRHHPAVGSRPGAARDTACPPDRLVPHAPAAPTQPHRARRRDARAILRRAVAGGLAARDRSGGARGRILPRRPGRGVDLHPTAVLRAARPGLDPSGREEALVRHVEEPPRLQPGDSAGGPYASDTRGEAAFRAEVHARGREAAVAPCPPAPPAAPLPPPPPPRPPPPARPAAPPPPRPLRRRADHGAPR